MKMITRLKAWLRERRERPEREQAERARLFVEQHRAEPAKAEPVDPGPQPPPKVFWSSADINYENRPNARAPLQIERADILAVPTAAYVAAQARFSEIVSASMLETEYCFPRIEITLASARELMLDEDQLEVWILKQRGEPLVFNAASADFSIEDTMLIVRPFNDGMATLQAIGWTAYRPTLRLYLNGCAVKGSDFPLGLTILDVAALAEEAPTDPAKEYKRIVKAFGTCEIVTHKHVYSRYGGWCLECGDPRPTMKGKKK